jgi:hypothetical protein
MGEQGRPPGFLGTPGRNGQAKLGVES